MIEGFRRMRISVTVAVVLTIVAGLVAAAWGIVGRAERVVQPLAFNHVVHLEKASLECMDCHTNAGTHVYAGIPGRDICLDCHDIDEEEDDPNPEKAKMFAFEDSDRDIPWVRVALTRPDVFFSHRRHVTAAEIDCLQCHPDQPTLTAPPTSARLVMTMDECIACHLENGASEDCLVCHR